MGSAENDHAADNVQAYRIRIQKKSWRASKALSELHRRKKMLLLCWVAWPVERLQSELEWLDNNGKGLLDVAFDDLCNPFFKARVALSQLVHDAPRGRFKSLLDMVPSSQHNDLISELRRMGLSLGAQVAWRFKEFQTYPYLWGVLFHPAATLAMKADAVKRFFSSNLCCRQRGCSDKMFDGSI